VVGILTVADSSAFSSSDGQRLFARDLHEACVGMGAKYILYNHTSHTVYSVNQQDKLARFAGHKVRISGRWLETKLILRMLMSSASADVLTYPARPRPALDGLFSSAAHGQGFKRNQDFSSIISSDNDGNVGILGVYTNCNAGTVGKKFLGFRCYRITVKSIDEKPSAKIPSKPVSVVVIAVVHN